MLHHILYPCNSADVMEFTVLLHGFGGNHRVWKKQIPELQKVSNVLAINLPSHYDGNVKLTQLQNAGMAVITQEILQVLEKYHIREAVFMGVSLGTVFVKYIEMYYPKYVRNGILVGAIGYVGTFLKGAVNVFSKIGDKLPFKLVYRIFSKILMPMRVSRKSRKLFCECAKALNKYEFKAYMNIFKEHFSLVKRFAEKKHKSNCYILGEWDKCFLKGATTEAMQTNAELVVLKHSGHVCNIDSTDEFNRIMLEYIAKQKHLFACRATA